MEPSRKVNHQQMFLIHCLDNHLKLVQVGTQTVFEQIPVELAEQGVVFTDFHSALEEIPELVEEFFMSSVKYDDDKFGSLSTLLTLTVVLFSTFQIT